MMKKLPNRVPLYPSFGTVLFPRTTLPLVIREPKDKQMIEAALQQGHRMIGVIQPFSENDKRLHQKGCLGKIVSFHESDEGFLILTLKGISRFDLVQELVSHEPFRIARISTANYGCDLKEQEDPFVDRKSLITLLEGYLVDNNIGANWDEIEQVSDEHLISSVAMSCPFDPAEKQAILETKSLGERSELISTFITMANPLSKGRDVTYH